MMSQTAPAVETHDASESMSGNNKDNAFVSFYNDCDISDYLYTKPAFEAGFLPLEPLDAEEAKIAHSGPVPAATRRPTETFNTGTTPPANSTTTTAMKQNSVSSTTPLRSNMKSGSTNSKATKVVERRPSFIEVTVPDVHHAHHNTHRRHSSEAHLPMSWWPAIEDKSQHQWVEAADEEEDMIEDEMFYASYD